MCTRYTTGIFFVKGATSIAEGTEIYPGDKAPVCFYRNGKLEYAEAAFGFKREQDGKLVLNARAESVAVRTMFAPLLAHGVFWCLPIIFLNGAA